MAALKGRSGECWQRVVYECVHAPLNFKGGATFFTAAGMRGPFGRIGDREAACPCAADRSCAGGTSSSILCPYPHLSEGDEQCWAGANVTATRTSGWRRRTRGW